MVYFSLRLNSLLNRVELPETAYIPQAYMQAKPPTEQLNILQWRHYSDNGAIFLPIDVNWVSIERQWPMTQIDVQWNQADRRQ